MVAFDFDSFRKLGPEEQEEEILREEAEVRRLKVNEKDILDVQQFVRAQINDRRTKIDAQLQRITDTEATLAGLRRRLFPSVVDRVEIGVLERRIPRLRGSITRWQRQIDEFLAGLRSQRIELRDITRRIRDEEARIAEKRRVPPPPPPPPPPVEEFIGRESSTGFKIYYDPENEEYVVRNPNIVDPNTGIEQEVARERKIAVAWTGSIDTGGGHQPIHVEITAVTVVERMGKNEITNVEVELEQAVFKYARENNWGNLIQEIIAEGIEYDRLSLARSKYKQTPDHPRVWIHFEKTRPKSQSYMGQTTLG